MLRINPKYIARARAAERPEDLQELLQSALQLEHATIPPYLAAAYSLQSGTNSRIADTLKDIAKEEMYHMALIGNLMLAIGGRPEIAGPDFLPQYPGPLPMDIGGDLTVGLKKYSRDLVHDVFMEIERPETPIHIPVVALRVEAVEFGTIGAFYAAIAERIEALGEDIFIGDPAHQVIDDSGLPSQLLFPIVDVETATRAIDWIVEEGEGTSKLPFDREGQLAHYYRFEEIFHGREVKEDAAAPNGYSYSGPEIQMNSDEIHDLPDNPMADDYADGTRERAIVDAFNQSYCDMLRDLQRAYNGEPAHIRQAVTAMGLVRRIATRAVRTIDPATNKSLGLTFEYMPPVTS